MTVAPWPSPIRTSTQPGHLYVRRQPARCGAVVPSHVAVTSWPVTSWPRPDNSSRRRSHTASWSRISADPGPVARRPPATSPRGHVVTSGGNLLVIAAFRIDTQLQRVSNYFLVTLSGPTTLQWRLQLLGEFTGVSNYLLMTLSGPTSAPTSVVNSLASPTSS